MNEAKTKKEEAEREKEVEEEKKQDVEVKNNDTFLETVIYQYIVCVYSLNHCMFLV